MSFSGPTLSFSDFCSATPPPYRRHHSTQLCSSTTDEVPDPFQRIYLPPRLREIFSQYFDPSKFSSFERLTNFIKFSAEGSIKTPLEWMGDFKQVPNIYTPIWVNVTVDDFGVVHLDGFILLNDKLMAALMVMKQGFDTPL